MDRANWPILWMRPAHEDGSAIASGTLDQESRANGFHPVAHISQTAPLTSGDGIYLEAAAIVFDTEIEKSLVKFQTQLYL